HLHIPGPDPLTNPSGEARQKFYGRAVRGTPAIFFNGSPAVAGGGPREAAGDKDAGDRAASGPPLETHAPAAATATAGPTGRKTQIRAKVTKLPREGDTVRLRLVLVEEAVKYQGGNRLPTHHRVVRAMPGGPAGKEITAKAARHSATVDLAELRKDLKKYL